MEKSIAKLKDYYKVENGGISFTQVIDCLPHDAAAIHAFSVEYMTQTYAITKYKVLQQNDESKIIIGEGEFNAFESYAAYPNQYTFTCNPSLRINAKDGKVRVSVSVKTYTQIRTNGNIKENKSVSCRMSPLSIPIVMDAARCITKDSMLLRPSGMVSQLGRHGVGD